ncbi:DUF4429 domain-containing protein [Streptomyces sp. NPDC004610]|uniref:DUF4429 domain-containing protein n=1 Tax=unclassified Streptomyces TaxID=2593676 RepID=UPI0033B468FC
MAEIIQRDGTWAFDGTTVRITPGLHRSVPLFRQTYGEITVPLEAVAGVVYEPERKRGRLRLRLREGADPLLQATGGRLPDPADPYRLAVETDRAGVAEYMAEEIRRALLLDQIPKEPTGAYLLAGPPVPVSVRSSDGTVSFDGTRIRIDWADTSDRVKRATGPRIIDVRDLVQVEWLPNSGYEDGYLRFVTREAVLAKPPPEKDPYALDLWGSVRRDLLTALVATAVTARLPHPSIGRDAGRDTGRDAWRDSGRDAWRDSGRDAGGDSGGDEIVRAGNRRAPPPAQAQAQGQSQARARARAEAEGPAQASPAAAASAEASASAAAAAAAAAAAEAKALRRGLPGAGARHLGDGHHDVLLRRLRELGELHRDGVLTDEEFAMTKAVVLRGFEE